MFQITWNSKQTKKAVERSYLFNVFFRVLWANFYHLAHSIHKITKKYAADDLKQRNQKALKIIVRSDLAKSHTREYSTTPIPCQYILL